MQAALASTAARPTDREWVQVLPLYVSSLVVTLAAVGAVGVTITAQAWTPIWVGVAFFGHLFSLGLRRLRVPPEAVFFPVMVVGSLVLLQLAFAGSPLTGLDAPLSQMPLDIATALLISTLAVLRTFTLVTDASLLFSTVPAITMLALVGSTNPNAEIPLFFSLMILASLFSTSYEAHLRRIARKQQPASPLLFHLLAAWCVTLLVATAALVFPLLIQPALGPLSPFGMPAIQRLQGLVSFTQASTTQAPVGQGPINLSPTPVCKIYAEDGDLFRTSVFSNYTGRGWTTERPPNVTDFRSDERAAPVQGEGNAEGITYKRPSYRFRFPADPDRTLPAPRRVVRQRIVYEGPGTDAIPAYGRVLELRYGRSQVNLHASGCVSAGIHLSQGTAVELSGEVVQPDPEALRKAPPVDLETFGEPETLSLPQSTYPVQSLAREVTAGIANPYDRLQALVGYVEKKCRYTLQEDTTPQGEDAAVYYLLQTRQGACDLSATGVAVMCRAVGIPARVAVGYIAAEPLPTGDGWQIRQSHLHMWVEAFFPGYGWLPFNPSPPLAAVHETPLQVVSDRIHRLFSKIGGGGLDALLLVTVVLLTVALAGYGGWVQLRGRWAAWQAEEREIRASPGAAVAVFYRRALLLLGRRGWQRDAWMTPREYLDWIRAEGSDLLAQKPAAAALAAMEQLTGIFERAQYAEEAEIEQVRQAAADLAQIARFLPRRAVATAAPRKMTWARTGKA